MNNGASNNYKYTLVSTAGVMNGKKREYQMFTLLDSTYRVTMLDAMGIMNLLKSTPGAVSNMEIGKDGRPTSSNGSLERYGFRDTMSGVYVGVPTYVIIDRIEENGVLKGYTIYTPSNQISIIDAATAVSLAEQKLICNGKIRVSGNGTKTVSSIKGEYNLKNVETPKAGKMTTAQKKEAEVVIKPMFTTFNNNTKVSYMGVIVSAKRVDILSKVLEECEKERVALVDKIAAVGGEKVREELKPITFDSTEKYIVIPNELAFSICEQYGAKIKFPVKNITISVMHYMANKEGEFIDANMKLGSDFKLKAEGEYPNSNIELVLRTFAEKFAGQVKEYVQ